MALKASWRPPARAVVVGGTAWPVPAAGAEDVLDDVAVVPVEAAGAVSSVPAGPLDWAVICAFTPASIEPVVFAPTATAPSVPVVVTSLSLIEASAAD